MHAKMDVLVDQLRVWGRHKEIEKIVSITFIQKDTHVHTTAMRRKQMVYKFLDRNIRNKSK